MLLANFRVARALGRAFPARALLRRHPEPNPRKLADLDAFATKHGIPLNTSSAGALHASLTALGATCDASMCGASRSTGVGCTRGGPSPPSLA